MTEFDLIARWFDRPVDGARGVRRGVGDDAALIAPAAGRDLAVSTDMLVAGRHFAHDADAENVGWKTLAVNLSDLAAMGARPLAFTLAIALPSIDERWLDRFAAGLFACAGAFDCPLVGGDTTRGPLATCVTVMGEVDAGRALERGAAQTGDDVWLSGTVGGAAFALAARGRGDAVDAVSAAALDRPVPRIALGRALVGIANAAIDVSDGLAQDLGHVADRSDRGAEVDVAALPLAAALGAGVDREDALGFALAGGDDYELCFTAPVGRRDAVARAAAGCDTHATRIGRIVDGRGVALIDAEGRAWRPRRSLRGFDHFA